MSCAAQEARPQENARTRTWCYTGTQCLLSLSPSKLLYSLPPRKKDIHPILIPKCQERLAQLRFSISQGVIQETDLFRYFKQEVINTRD